MQIKDIIKNYKIGNNDVIEEAYVGTLNDYDDFTTAIVEKLFELGYPEPSDEYTLPGLKGKFIDHTIDLESTVYQMNIPFSELNTEMKITLFIDEYGYDEDGNKLYIYGIYKEVEDYVDNERILKLIKETEDVKEFLKEVECYLSSNNSCTVEDEELICEYVNNIQGKDEIEEVLWFEENILNFPQKIKENRSLF